LQSAHIPDVDASSAMLLREIIGKGDRFS